METYIAAIIGIVVAVVGIILLLFLLMLCFAVWQNDFPRKDKYIETNVELRGKTAIVTGSSKGIGAVTAKELARRGARVILAVRNIRKTEPIRDDIIQSTGNEQVVIMQVDLSDLESIHKFCSEFNRNEAGLHILINNAGVAASSERTMQGFNMVMGVNYIAPFLTTHLLLDKLKQSAPSRVITLTSHGPMLVDAVPCIGRSSLDLTLRDAEGTPFPNLNDKRDSRLYSIMMMKELAWRVKDSNVTCFSVTPGAVFTGQGDIRLFDPMMKAMCRDEWTGSQTVLYCALQEGIEEHSGKLFDNCHPRDFPKLAKHNDVVRDLFNATLQVIPENYKTLTNSG